MLDEVFHVLLERGQTRLTRKRLAVAVEGEDHVGLGVGQLEAVFADVAGFFIAGRDLLPLLRNRSRTGQPLIVRPEIHRPHAVTRILEAVDLIPRIAEVAEDEFMLGEPHMNECFEPAIVLHPLGQRVADDADVVSLFEFEGKRLGGHQRRNEEQERKQARDSHGESFSRGNGG